MIDGGMLVFGAPERASAASNLASLQERSTLCLVDNSGVIGAAQALNNKQNKNKYGFIFHSKSQ
jgi:hypothetical protein